MGSKDCLRTHLNCGNKMNEMKIESEVRILNN